MNTPQKAVLFVTGVISFFVVVFVNPTLYKTIHNPNFHGRGGALIDIIGFIIFLLRPNIIIIWLPIALIGWLVFYILRDKK